MTRPKQFVFKHPWGHELYTEHQSEAIAKAKSQGAQLVAVIDPREWDLKQKEMSC